MNILVACDNAGPWGGAQNAMLAEVAGLRKVGHEVRILSNDYAPAGQQPLADYTYPSHDLNTRAPGPYLRKIYNPRAKRVLQRAFDEFRPDVLHLHLFLLQMSPSVLYAGIKAPVFATVHDCGAFCPIGNRYLRRSESVCTHKWGVVCIREGCITAFKYPQMMLRTKLLMARQQNVTWIAPSTFMRDELLRAGFTNVVHLPYGFDLDSYTFTSMAQRAKANAILFCSRLDYSKGAHVLVRAFAEVVKKLPKMRLVIAGDGSQYLPLKALVKELGLENSVDMPGWQSGEQIQQLMKQAAVLAAPFLGPDNFPLVICESMFIGTPVVSTNVGGVPDLVDDENTGVLVLPNDIRSLGTAIRKLLSGNPAHREAISQNARKKAEKMLALNSHVDSLTGLYQPLTLKNGAS